MFREKKQGKRIKILIFIHIFCGKDCLFHYTLFWNGYQRLMSKKVSQNFRHSGESRNPLKKTMLFIGITGGCERSRTAFAIVNELRNVLKHLLLLFLKNNCHFN
jgi:hypothetical protein